jgi:hypothetical protein
MKMNNSMTVLNISQHSMAERFMRATKSFDDTAKAFPESVREVSDADHPKWGSAFYGRTAEGGVTLVKESWDTSG